ncbi:MAG: helix-turn-helix domain-containing protein [Minisyncoccales bacterium]
MEQQNNNQAPKDYILSLYEVCEMLGKSSRTISRYVHRDILHPVGIKSRQGTLEYRFSRAEVEVLKQREDEIRQFNYMPQLSNMRQNMASFASVNYQQPQTMPQSFVMPGISFQNAPGQTIPSQHGVPEQPFSKEAKTVAAAPEDNARENTASEPTANHKESFQDTAPNQDHSNEQIIILLKETTEMLRDQLQVKDGQIKNLDEKIGQLIERNRETNILLKGLQDKMVLLEKPKNERKIQPRTEIPAVSSEEVSPSSSPAPKVVEPVANPIKLRVTYREDAVCAPENNQSNINPQNKNKTVANGAGDGGRIPAQQNDDQPGKGFFGKIFR